MYEKYEKKIALSGLMIPFMFVLSMALFLAGLISEIFLYAGYFVFFLFLFFILIWLFYLILEIYHT